MMNYSKNRCNFYLPSKHVLAAFEFTSENDFPTFKGLLAFLNVYFANVSFHFEKMHSSLGES